MLASIFTIGIGAFHTTSPPLLALAGGAATNRSVSRSVYLALVSQSKGQLPIPVSQVARQLLILLGAMGLSALLAGVIGHQLAARGLLTIPADFATAIPIQRHHNFIAVWCAHTASYFVGFAGAALLCYRAWNARGRPLACPVSALPPQHCRRGCRPIALLFCAAVAPMKEPRDPARAQSPLDPFLSPPFAILQSFIKWYNAPILWAPKPHRCACANTLAYAQYEDSLYQRQTSHLWNDQVAPCVLSAAQSSSGGGGCEQIYSLLHSRMNNSLLNDHTASKDGQWAAEGLGREWFQNARRRSDCALVRSPGEHGVAARNAQFAPPRSAHLFWTLVEAELSALELAPP